MWHKDTNFLGMKGWFHKLMWVGWWSGSKILRVCLFNQVELCFIEKIKFIEHVFVRRKIKNPATKIKVSCSITRLQFVTYAKFIRIRNTSHRSVGQRVWNTNTLSESMRRDSGYGWQIFPLLLPPTPAYEHAVVRSFESVKFCCFV